MRLDQQLAEKWISPGSKVLDLGCGDGELLAHMSKKHNISAYGLEIDQEKIAIAVSRGLNIIQQDLNLGLHRFDDQTFDYVVMAQALQAVDAPDVLLRDMVRVGKQAIITFPNFAHWKTRSYLAFKGRMPVSNALPYMWYNTPNIHLCTFRDFEALCAENNIRIINRLAVNVTQKDSLLSKRIPNLFAEVAIYRVSAL
ncbi:MULTISPECIES: methionine biosynthesis protein MetW [Acinetobacter]|jgi:methionine biosynthesis protein MetW|uniref:Methionine biosynthesis protein MetW n=1 Tax=Acinetobacter pollinis TaxID=2605270 RepID=A0ABU6DPZ8_9GAMM|nr:MULTISPECIES: methionine biosynthesis protein MetW [Acinetobacter]MBF7690709.1 methionine biosynthesis protein MetW [Acinetobacter pollinis]MBF7692366.1 methionine biosynthesis protein MetW [Acinetobacter pollinis]MBF7698268.1 methionine biosynthesis protein MetW [Acinetobacter pollinis]MBF7701019.1 methionine biosynthesis protein MetW [Acinetobacter pollinis]MEB5475478.1 methionine biosynthesis protein MetW [Acinetobacter pollinis]